MESLPAGFGGLAALQKLDLCGCVALKELPPSVGDLASLLELDLSNCSSVQLLPDSLGEASPQPWARDLRLLTPVISPLSVLLMSH